jgi:predicted phosphodiesterase
MRVALFSDIHSNLLALQSVLKSIRAHRVDHLICLGDIVGYNAKPSECLDLVREIGADVIMGNHDFYASNTRQLKWFNLAAKEGLEYTRGKLSALQKKWLMSLPLRREYQGFTAVHASLDHPKKWDYVTTLEAADRHFHYQTESVCFIGHTHQVRVHCSILGRVKNVKVGQRLVLKKGLQYLVNVGSVGQPRDNNPAASYVIYDVSEQVLEFHRVIYPVWQAAHEVLCAGLPELLGVRLIKGV